MTTVYPSFERALIHSIALRNITALSKLYDLTRAQLFAVARDLLPSDTEANQVVFSVFERVWNGSEEHEESDALMPWLIEITKRQTRLIEWGAHQDRSAHDAFAVWFMLERTRRGGTSGQ